MKHVGSLLFSPQPGTCLIHIVWPNFFGHPISFLAHILHRKTRLELQVPKQLLDLWSVWVCMYHLHTKTASMCQSVSVSQCPPFNTQIVMQRNRIAGLREQAPTKYILSYRKYFNACKSIKDNTVRRIPTSI